MSIQKQKNKHLASFERITRKYINTTIRQQIKLTHPYGDVEITFTAIPYFYFKQIVRNWEEYIPQRRKSGCIDYYETCDEASFRRSFPKLHLTKHVSSEMTMKLTVGKNAPVRAIYHRKNRILYLSFWYELYPYPEIWYPTYKKRAGGSSNSLGKQCWKQKVKNVKVKVVTSYTKSAD